MKKRGQIAESILTYDPLTQMTTELVPITGGAVRLHYNTADERVLKAQGSVATLYLHGLSDYPVVGNR